MYFQKPFTITAVYYTAANSIRYKLGSDIQGLDDDNLKKCAMLLISKKKEQKYTYSNILRQ